MGKQQGEGGKSSSHSKASAVHEKGGDKGVQNGIGKRSATMLGKHARTEKNDEYNQTTAGSGVQGLFGQNKKKIKRKKLRKD